MTYSNKLLWTLVLIALASLCACKHTNGEKTSESGQTTLADSIAKEISVDTVSMMPVHDELTLNGRVSFNPERVAQVYALYSGYITETHAEIGDYVRKGATLAVVKSDEVADMVRQHTEAAEKVRLAKRTLKATQQMAAGGMSSERDVMEAEQDLNVAQAEQLRIDQLYALHGIGKQATYIIKAPAAGFVVAKTATRGGLLRDDNDAPLFTISNLSDVWVQADVYEGDIAKITQGAEAHITPLAYKDKEFTGHVDHIDHMLSAESKTMGIRIELSNPQELLKPGMFTTVRVCTGNAKRSMPAVSTKSVIFDSGKEYVVVMRGHDYEIRDIQVHSEADGRSYIQQGLAAGDVVVSQGALLMYNALKQ